MSKVLSLYLYTILAVVGDRWEKSMFLLGSDVGFIFLSVFGIPSTEMRVGHNPCLQHNTVS